MEDDEDVTCEEVDCKGCELVDEGDVDDIANVKLDSDGRLTSVVGAMRKDCCAAC